jgi:hypothetical protein
MDKAKSASEMAGLLGSGKQTAAKLSQQNPKAYEDYISFKNQKFPKNFVSNPAVTTLEDTSPYIWSSPEFESITLTSGVNQYVTSDFTGFDYENLFSNIKSMVGSDSTAFELSAVREYYTSSNATTKTTSAIITGYYDSISHSSKVSIIGGTLTWSPYSVDSEGFFGFSADSNTFRLGTDLLIGSIGSINVEGGNIDVAVGDINAGGNVTSGFDVVSSGNITSGFDIISQFDITSTFGNVTSSEGDVISTIGNVTAGEQLNGKRLRLYPAVNANTTSTDHNVQIGTDGSFNLRIDNNSILAVLNGATSQLSINPNGGAVAAGGATGVYGNSITGRDVYITSSGVLGYNSASSREIKRDIEALDFDPLKILEIEPMSYRYIPGILKAENGNNPDELQAGFIAEDLDAAGLSMLVDYDPVTNKPVGIQYSRYSLALQAVVRHLSSEIQDLKSRLEVLENK